MGVISEREQITKLLDYPDLSSVTHWMETAENDVEWRISKIIDEGEYIAPDPLMNLTLAKSRMQLAYLEALQQGVEQEKLDMMLTFLTTAQAMLDEAALPPEQMQMLGDAAASPEQIPMEEEMTETLEDMAPATPGPMELPQEMETAPPPEVLPS